MPQQKQMQIGTLQAKMFSQTDVVLTPCQASHNVMQCMPYQTSMTMQAMAMATLEPTARPMALGQLTKG
jgi:methylthioribose-1-phosphate isomerase